MKIILTTLLLFIAPFVFSQSGIYKKYQAADSFMQTNDFPEAYKILKQIEPVCDKNDTLYNYILWYYVSATTQIEKQFRDHEKFDSSLAYGLEALQLITRAKPYFGEKFAAREYWMTKNIIVSYFGLAQLDNAKRYKNVLYKAYAEKQLPEGIDEYFNFSFYKYDNKNIWGYEWFEELPQDRMSKSFSKIVYYVYSTKPDGSDSVQLYRLHVLMFHKLDSSAKFDYVLTKRLENATNEVSGTLYDYIYTKDIDYKKLDADIREVLKGHYRIGSSHTIKKE